METEVIAQARKLLEDYTKWLVDRAELPQGAWVSGFVDLYLNQTDQRKLEGALSYDEAISERQKIGEMYGYNLLTKEEFNQRIDDIRARMGLPKIKRI